MTNFTEPLKFKSGVTLRNRLMMSPMTTKQSFYNGSITRDEIDYYTQRAAGLGAVITGAANVEDLGKGWDGELSIAHDTMLPGLRALAKGIQSQGTKAIIQLVHAGRMTHRSVLGGQQIVSASAVAALRDDAETPREMTTAEVQQTIQAFGDATRRAIQAGFDGIELHGANTYLIQQFFSPHSNRRTDQYGGKTPQERYRFIDELLTTVFAAVDQYADRPFVVGYRFSPEEFETPGIRFADTMWLLTQLRESRLDYVHVSLKGYDRIAHDPDYQDKSIMSYVHEALQGKLPLVAVGGVRTRTDVENVLQDAELVAVGEQLLFDPSWAVKLANNADETMLTAPFEQALEITPLTRPLYEFAASIVKN